MGEDSEKEFNEEVKELDKSIEKKSVENSGLETPDFLRGNKDSQEDIEEKKESIIKEEKPIKKENKELKRITDFFSNKNTHIYLLIILLLFAFGLRLMYFNTDQAVWWDSADYLTGAKVIGQGLELDHYDFNPRRPFFLSVFWGFLYMLGGGETTLRISMLLFSIAGVWLTYLLGKEIYNKNVGLIAGFGMSVLWLHLFHTARLLSDLPALTLWLATAYFSYKLIFKEEKKMFIPAGIFLGLLLFTRASNLIYLFPLLVLGLAKDGFKFFKNKHIWLAVGLALLIISPFFIWLGFNYDNPVQKFTGLGGDEVRFIGSLNPVKLWDNLTRFSDIVFTDSLLYLLTFSITIHKIAGLFVILLVLFLNWDLFLGFDLLIKKNKGLIKKLFLLVWFFTPYIFFSLSGSNIENRYFFGMIPAMFIIFGNSLVKLKHHFSKNKRHIWVVLILILLLSFSYVHLRHNHFLIEETSGSFRAVKNSGIWLYEHTEEGDLIVSQSYYQHMYYAERDILEFHNSTGKMTENEFNRVIKELKPKYMVVGLNEPGFTPEWVYSYAKRNSEKVKLVSVFKSDEGKNLLVIFEFVGL